MNKRMLEALENSYAKYYNLAYYLTKNKHDAEDVMQDVRLILLSANFKKGVSNIQAYLFRVVRNTALKYIKESSKYTSVPTIDERIASCSDEHIMRVINNDIIGACFTALPEDVRIPLFEHFAYKIPLRSLELKYGVPYGKLRHWKNKLPKIAKKYL